MLKRYKIAAIPLSTKLFYLLVLIFITGVVFGVLTSENEITSAIADGYSSVQGDEFAADNFFRTITADAVFLALVFLLGFSAVSLPVLILVPFFKGLGIGVATVALLNADPSFWGIVRCFVGFSLTTAVSSYIVIMAVVSSLRLSLGLFSHLSGRCDAFDLTTEWKKYCLKFVLFTVIIVINAVTDTLLSVLLY